MTSLLLLALMQTPAPQVTPWVPAPLAMEDQTCGPNAHRHSIDKDDKGHYVVNREKGEPDIVFDGLCHDNNSEKVCRVTPKGDCVDPSRKVLPVPKGE
jgi:hypothetical protein